MSDTIPSTNMGMPVPIVGTETGPQWALDINSCLAILDAHDHSPGYGAPITPAGLNISSDLTFSSNNATGLRSARFTSQSAVLALAADLDCLYVVGDDLYYNDGSGNNVRITQSGGVAGSPGSISNLTSPASAAYVSANSTFVWQSAANTPAYLDAASILLRNLSANSKALTLNPPAAMGANFSLTLPSLPVSQKIMTLDASGNMSAPYIVDNSTLEIISNSIRVKTLGITDTQLASDSVTVTKILDANVTRAKLAPLSLSISGSSGAFSTASTGYVDVTNLTRPVSTSGRPVFIGLIATTSDSYVQVGSYGAGGTNNYGKLAFLRNGVIIAEMGIGAEDSGTASNTPLVRMPPAAFSFIEELTAGSYTYKVQAIDSTGTSTVYVNNCKLVVYELF